MGTSEGFVTAASEMWRAQAGHSTQQRQEEEDDDWETDPDFVVRSAMRDEVVVYIVCVCACVRVCVRVCEMCVLCGV